MAGTEGKSEGRGNRGRRGSWGGRGGSKGWLALSENHHLLRITGSLGEL